MTRSTPLMQAGATAKKGRAAPTALPELAAMTFRVFEDNGGGYQWSIVADGGEMLARSTRFASYEDADQAARIVRGGASRASFEDRSSGDPPRVDLPARRRDAARARDRLDVERWLDEGGSFSSEAVARWPAAR